MSVLKQKKLNNVMFYEAPTQIRTHDIWTPMLTCKYESGCMKLYVSVSIVMSVLYTNMCLTLRHTFNINYRW